jgi:hypothetical protein
MRNAPLGLPILTLVTQRMSQLRLIGVYFKHLNGTSKQWKTLETSHKRHPFIEKHRNYVDVDLMPAEDGGIYGASLSIKLKVDLWDLGEFNQKGTRTKWGSSDQLTALSKAVIDQGVDCVRRNRRPRADIK